MLAVVLLFPIAELVFGSRENLEVLLVRCKAVGHFSLSAVFLFANISLEGDFMIGDIATIVGDLLPFIGADLLEKSDSFFNLFDEFVAFGSGEGVRDRFFSSLDAFEPFLDLKLLIFCNIDGDRFLDMGSGDGVRERLCV